MSKANKQLTLSAIKKEDAKRYNEKQKVDINGYSIMVDKVFRPTKIQNLLLEATRNMEQIYENSNDFTSTATAYMYFLLIKHFTNVKLPDELGEQLAALNILIDNEYIAPIIGALDPNEVQKVTEFFRQVLDATSEENMTFIQNLVEDYVVENNNNEEDTQDGED